MTRRLAAAALLAAGALLPVAPAAACDTVPCHAVDVACTTRPGLACAWLGRVCTLLGPECD
jgi:hypothetical protein